MHIAKVTVLIVKIMAKHGRKLEICQKVRFRGDTTFAMPEIVSKDVVSTCVSYLS